MSEELFIRLLNWFYYGYANGAFNDKGEYIHKKKLSWRFPYSNRNKFFTYNERKIIKQFLNRIKINDKPLINTKQLPYSIFYSNFIDLENCLIMNYEILIRSKFNRKRINNNLAIKSFKQNY